MPTTRKKTKRKKTKKTKRKTEPDLSYIEEAIRPLAIPIRQVKIDPNNARQHPNRSFESVRESLRKYGQQLPIIIQEDGTVVAGEARLTAATNLGWKHIAVVRTKLTGNDATAYALVDNRTGELSDWNYEVLSGQLQTLQGDDYPIDGLGWEPHEIEPMLTAEWKPDPVGEFPDVGNPGGIGAVAPIKLDEEQRARFDEAAEHIRVERSEADLTDGEIVLMLADEHLDHTS